MNIFLVSVIRDKTDTPLVSAFAQFSSYQILIPVDTNPPKYNFVFYVPRGSEEEKTTGIKYFISWNSFPLFPRVSFFDFCALWIYVGLMTWNWRACFCLSSMNAGSGWGPPRSEAVLRTDRNLPCHPALSVGLSLGLRLLVRGEAMSFRSSLFCWDIPKAEEIDSNVVLPLYCDYLSFYLQQFQLWFAKLHHNGIFIKFGY